MMPPKTKKLAGASATRRTARGTKTTAANTVVDAPPLDGSETVPQEVVKAEEGKADHVAEEAAVEDKPPMDGHDNATDLNVKHMEEPSNDRHGLVLEKKEGKVKDPVDEYERGERLDFEDNEVEYEPEEYVGVDYDEKDQEDVQEEGYEYVEEVEEDVVEEEGGDTGEEDMDNVHEVELEGEEEDEDAGEAEQTDFVEAAGEDEHQEVVKERRRRKEFEVFVGGLDKDATEEDLKNVFSAVGEVTEVRLMRNSQTRKNKGFAFLRFATVEQAKRAVIELKNPVVNGKKCGATPSQDNDTLFLGNICKTWTKEALEKKLKHYGVENTEYITLAEDSNYPGLNRGFAFLEFASRSDAMDAFRRLQKGGVLFGVERSARVSFADSFVDSGDDIMAQVKTIFVDGIPASWDEDHVRELLNKYGKIEKIELARNMPSARRKDYGFVSFDTHDAAVSCARSINNAELGEGDNKVKVRARLSRPLRKGKGKHIPHGRSIPSHPSRAPWTRPLPRSLPGRATTRKVGSRIPPVSDRGLKRPSRFKDNRSTAIAAPLHRAMPPRHRAMAPPHRSRPLPPPLPPTSRSYNRRAPVPVYPKGGSMKRDYPRREEIPPPKRRAAAADYDSRRTSYRDEYSTRSSYSEMSRSSSATHAAAPRRAYQEDAYDPRYDRRTPPSYREGRARDYDSVSGSKRPYSSLDDVPPRYADDGMPQSRARLDYDMAGGSSQYGDAYNDRVGRSSLGYGSGRSTMSSQDTHGLYGSRLNMGYGSYGSSNVGGGAYSSSFASGDFVSRGSDVGGSSYPSMYTSRGVGNSGYTGRSGSGPYY